MTDRTTALKSRYELAIVGCGPAGMAAAVNAKIRRRDFILLGAEFCSPKLAKAPVVDNYLGFPEINGDELRQRFLRHLEQMDILIIPWKVSNIYPGPPFTLLGPEQTIEAEAVILATGVTAQKLLPGEKEFLGQGVGYCATCDAPLFKGKTVAIIADGPAAEHEANYVAEICAKVYYVPLYRELGRLDARIEVQRGPVREIVGDKAVSGLRLDSGNLELDGVFILREILPAEQLVEGLAIVNGAIQVNHGLETNIPGLFAAGDCTGQPYQLLKAAGEGAVAALQAIRYLDARPRAPERE